MIAANKKRGANAKGEKTETVSSSPSLFHVAARSLPLSAAAFVLVLLLLLLTTSGVTAEWTEESHTITTGESLVLIR